MDKELLPISCASCKFKDNELQFGFSVFPFIAYYVNFSKVNE